MEATDKYYKQILNKTKIINMILEIAYPGNIGFMETIQFFKIATPEEVNEFDRLVAADDLNGAWELLQRVVGVRLHGLPQQEPVPA